MRPRIVFPLGVLALSFAVWHPAQGAANAAPEQGQSKSSYVQISKNNAQVKAPGLKLKFRSRQKGAKVKFNGADGPPPWAPAHGYRGKFGGAPEAYAPPFDIGLGDCNQTLLGALLGGAAGAAIGAQIGNGDGRTAAIIGGTVLGAVVGGSIGRSMDRLDQSCVGQALEHAPDGQSIAWNAQDDGSRYQVTPVSTYQDGGGRYCREYQTTAVVDGRSQQIYGNACRQPDGTWQLVD